MKSDRTIPVGERQIRQAFWVTRHATTILFFIIVLSAAGIYLAGRIPISVFPETNFPRVVIGVDNGVMPVEQMQVTITKPIEDAVNSRARPRDRPLHHQPRLRRGQPLLRLERRHVPDPPARRRRPRPGAPNAPRHAVITTNRLTFATFPILGYASRRILSRSRKLWELATYDLKPSLNRVDGVSNVVVQGDQIPNVEVTPQPSKLIAAGVTVSDVLNAVQLTNVVDSPGLLQTQHELVLGLIGGQVHDAAQLGQVVIKNTASGIPIRIADVAAVKESIEPAYTMVHAGGKPAILLNITRQPYQQHRAGG